MVWSGRILMRMLVAGTAVVVLTAVPAAGVAQAAPAPGGWSEMLPLGVKAVGRLPGGGAKLASASPIGLSPAAIAGVYNLPGMSPQSGAGAGQVIAIVDSFNDPNALADLNTFSEQYGYPQLPECTSLAESAPPCFETKFAEGKPPPPPKTGPASNLRIETPHCLSYGLAAIRRACGSPMTLWPSVRLYSASA